MSTPDQQPEKAIFWLAFLACIVSICLGLFWPGAGPNPCATNPTKQTAAQWAACDDYHHRRQAQ